MRIPGDFIVFADESGDHGLKNINADYPVFVLSCCVFEKTQYVERVCPELQRFKLRWWPHDAVVLHSSKMRRQEPPFAFLSSREKRERFMEDLAEVLRSVPFELVAVAIDKRSFRCVRVAEVDLYAVAMRECVELLRGLLGDKGETGRSTTLLIERRGRLEDAQLMEAFRRICDDANDAEQTHDLSLELVDKKANLVGLQIADLVGTPIGRHLLRPDIRNRAFEAIEGKFWRRDAGMAGALGLKKLP